MEYMTLQCLEKPGSGGINDVLQWFCRSLGIFSQRDKDNSCFRVFIELLKETKKGNALSSDELAARLGIVRGTVVHHLNRLIGSGLVREDRSRYSLKSKNLKELVSNLKGDVCSVLDQLEKVGSELDRSL